jgi:hypothetical protein
VVDFKKAAEPLSEDRGSSQLSISERLKKKFGLGADWKRRLELYRRLEACVLAHGDEAYAIISECVADAVGKEKPQHWFCRAVVNRLRDRKLLAGVKGGDPTW